MFHLVCAFVFLLLAPALPVTALAQGDEPAPAEATPAGETGAIEETGWDWDSFAPMDDAPKVRSQSVKKKPTDELMEQLAKHPRVGETAEPDFEADVHAAYALFPGAPSFKVIPSKRDRDMHPCSNCHAWTKSDPTPRKLKPPHDNFTLSHGLHGKGKFWCFTCHTLEGKGGLRTLEGQELDFGEAYVVCSQCHVNQARDWVYGAHGKRVANWEGERRVYNCTVCHYQHRPAWKPRDALAGPPVRQGLDRPGHWQPKPESGKHVFETAPVWERYATGPGRREDP